MLKSSDNHAAVATKHSDISKRIESIKEEAHEALMHLSFPHWPDDRRAAPNDMIRSSLFGVVKRGRRKMLDKQEIPAPSGWKLYYTGRRLDQTDLDIWLEVMHHARSTKPGGEIRFTLRSVLRALKHHDGASAYKWLKERLENMTLGGFSYESENGKKSGATGSLLRGFHLDEATGEAVAETNPRLRSLYESITYLDINVRLALDTQLSKWLHALIMSHARWIPTKVETLMLQSGTSYSRIRDFRADLRIALENLETRKAICSWSIDSADKVHIEKKGTPSQQRYTARSL